MNITNYVQSCVDDFQSFVGIDSFPDFKIISKEMSLEKATKQGFDAPASALYDSSKGLHSLVIWSKLYLPQMNAKYLVFHELTHILDAEVYSQKDKIKYVSNKGFTEFHAAQIDFMQILGAKNIFTPFSFDMNKRVETFSGTKTAKEYLDEARTLATSLIQRTDFPANIETLATTLGAIFNYYGRRSICKMYAKDYKDDADMSVISKLIKEQTVTALNNFMLGWLTPERVAIVDELY
ncbi:MAG: hypothetical protein K6B38_12215, partial [Ruminococcus sp.]|nr:hypothetical protein [Ruminococcus sp.]